MDIGSQELKDAYDNPAIGYEAFRGMYSGLNDSDFAHFILIEAISSQQNLSHTAQLIEAWGKKGRKLIEEISNTETLELRKSAIRVLGEIGDAKSTITLITAIGAWEEEIRETAAESLLAFIKGPSGLAISESLSNSKFWRIRAGLAKVIMNTGENRAGLVDRFGEETTRDLISALVNSLNYKEPRVRIACAMTLGHLQIEEARESINKLASSKIKQVNVAAIEALVALSGKSTLNFLNDLLKRKKNQSEVIIAAISGIGKLVEDNKTGFNALIRQRNHKDILVRKKLAWALGKYPRKESMEALVVLLADPDDLVSKEATESILVFGSDAVSSLLKELQNKKLSKKKRSHIRLSALHVLDDLEIETQIPKLVSSGILEDENPEVRIGIVNKLTRTLDKDRDKVGKALLKRISKENDNAVLNSMIKMLPLLRSGKIDKQLLKIINKRNVSQEVKNSCIAILLSRNWEPKKEKDHIIVALAVGDWEGITSISKKSSIKYIVQMLDNEDLDIRSGILESIYKIEPKLFKGRRKKKLLKKIREIAKKDEEEIRIKAIPLLGYLRDEKATKDLRKYWKKGTERIRNSVIFAYDFRQDEFGTKGLISILSTATDEELPAIQEALSGIKPNKKNIKILAQAFKNPNRNVRKVSSRASIMVNSPLIVPYLVKSLNTDNRFVRLNAAHGLNMLKWIPDIKQIVNFNIGLRKWKRITEWDLKKKVNRMSQEIEFNEQDNFSDSLLLKMLSNYKQSTKYMRKLIIKGNEKVRFQAMQVLALNEESHKSLKHITKLYTDPSDRIRSKLAELLAISDHSHPKDELKVLRVLINDKSQDVQNFAAMAYNHLASNKSIPDILDRISKGSITDYMESMFVECFVAIGDKSVNPILKSVNDNTHDLTEIGSEVLPQIRTGKSLNIYKKYFDKGNSSQIALSAGALATIDKTKYYQDILDLFYDPDPIIKLAALNAVGNDLNEDNMLKYVTPLLASEDIKLRYKASELLNQRDWFPVTEREELLYAKAAGNWNHAVTLTPFDQSMEDEMQLVLRSHVPQLIQPTALALAKMGDTAVDIFVDMVFDDDDELASTIISQLMKFGTKASDVIIRAYDRYESVDEKTVLVEMLGHIKGDAAEKKLIEIMKTTEDDNTLRFLAMRGLDEFNSQLAIPAYVTLLEDEDTDLAQQAVDELVQIGDTSIPEILHLLKSKEKKKVLYAIQILGRLKSRIANVPLLEYIQNPDLEIRHAAGIALSKTGWKPEVDSVLEMNYLVAIEDWARIERKGDKAMLRLIHWVQFDPNASIRDHSAEIMKSIWPELPFKSKNIYERQFRRLLGPRAHPVFEYLIDFGYEKPSLPIIKRIALIIKNLIIANSYFLFAIITAFILVGLVDSQFKGDALYSDVQFTIVIIILILQFLQSALITNYAERFIGLFENVAGVFGRGKRVAIWANRHFPLIVALIFWSTAYKVLTTEPESIDFIQNEDSLIGKVLISISTGRFGFVSTNIDLNFPSFKITEYFNIVDLPSLDVIFQNTKLSLILRGVIFLAVAFEVSKVGGKAIYQRSPIPNDPPAFYQKFALLIGLLIFYMLAFVEESTYNQVNQPLSNIPTHASRLGILVGSLIYLIFYSKDRPLGWLTAFVVIPTFALLKLVEVVLIPNAVDPFGILEQNEVQGLLILASTIPFTYFINRGLVKQLLDDETYTKDHTTVKVLVWYSWRILITTYVGYAVFITIGLLPGHLQDDVFAFLVRVPATILLYIYIVWAFRMFRRSSLRLNALFSIIPVSGLFYLIWGKQQSDPLPWTESIRSFEEGIEDPIYKALLIIPFILIGSWIVGRAKRRADEERDLEGIDPKIMRAIRTSKFIWISFLLTYFLIFGVELARDLQHIIFG